MKLGTLIAAASIIAVGYAASTMSVSTSTDRESLQRTDDGILAAFARGDVDGIMAFHHPDVAKALAFNKYLIGRDAVRADLSETFRLFSLEFVEHKVESLTFLGDAAVEQTAFAIKGTPKSGGTPFFFKGRAMVVYVRYEKSPSGWASIREIIQSATQ
jgi:ketosteroid isomerase-like protein